MVADLVTDVTAIVGTLTAVATLIIAVLVFLTARATHAAVNSNHAQEVARIDQLTQVIVKSPETILPPAPAVE